MESTLIFISWDKEIERQRGGYKKGDSVEKVNSSRQRVNKKLVEKNIKKNGYKTCDTPPQKDPVHCTCTVLDMLQEDNAH